MSADSISFPTNHSLFDPEQVPVRTNTTATTVREVFDFWVATCRAKSRPTPVLTDQRSRVIARAVREYGVPTCKDAIVGVTKSPWNMGHNPNGKRYDDITLILRNANNIERFAALVSDSEDWTAGEMEW